jgi:hypothetical protein
MESNSTLFSIPTPKTGSSGSSGSSGSPCELPRIEVDLSDSFSLEQLDNIILFLSQNGIDKEEDLDEYFLDSNFVNMSIIHVLTRIIQRYRDEFVKNLMTTSEVIDFVMETILGFEKDPVVTMSYNLTGISMMLSMTYDSKRMFTGIRVKMSLRDGQVFADGRFRVIRKIGRGNATVYLVHDNQNGEQYAFKAIGNMVEFQIEMNALEKLHGLDGVVHPISTLAINFGGISVYGYFMPYFRNGTLKEYASIHGFHRKTPENRRKLLRILRELATILKECHARGVFHCDIKPENILMDDNGNPVFADFGISKILLNKSMWFGLTKEELITEWWRDPFNWKASRSKKVILYRFSVLSDLWSLVLTIFAMFFGEDYNQCQRFYVFRKGLYANPNSQVWIDEAIDSVIDRSFVDRSDESFRSFFKRWLNIALFDASNQRNPTDVGHTQVVIDSFMENVDEMQRQLQ